MAKANKLLKTKEKKRRYAGFTETNIAFLFY